MGGKRHLGDLPVLTPGATEIAAWGPYGIGTRRRVVVEQGLLLYGIDSLCDEVSVDKAEQSAVVIYASLTSPFLAIVEEAVIATQLTPNPFARTLLIEKRFPCLFF
jgi:hypothetical protein